MKINDMFLKDIHRNINGDMTSTQTSIESVLAKNTHAQEFLEADYPSHEQHIDAMLVFEDSPELRLYKNARQYADVYPFVPYQFKLVADFLSKKTGVDHNEQLLVDVIKRTAEQVADKKCGLLISLDQFYPALEAYLDGTHGVNLIKQAEQNSWSGSNQDNQLKVAVLKVLLMIKDMEQTIQPTLNNITNLLIHTVDEDKMIVREQVAEALAVLISEKSIRENSGHFEL